MASASLQTFKSSVFEPSLG